MKLKTRIKLAWLELALAIAILAGAIAVDIARPHGSMSAFGLAFGLLMPLFALGPLCVSSWSRLSKTRAQLAELGPDAAPSVDLWTAPGAPGVIGVMVLVTALAAALVPALLFRG